MTSPGGQTIEVDRVQPAPPGIDDDHDGWLADAALPDPDELHTLDLEQLTPPDLDDRPPQIPTAERPAAPDWHWLHESPVDRSRS